MTRIDTIKRRRRQDCGRRPGRHVPLVKIQEESSIGANISDGFRVYKSMQDEVTALVTNPAGRVRGTEPNEVKMFAGWTGHAMERVGAGLLADHTANPLPVYPMRL